MDKTIYNKAADRLRVLCSRREYSSGDMLAKAAEYLARYGTDSQEVPDAAASIVESLRRDGYVDDLRYASAFARDKALLSGWGRIKIRYALAAKGLPEDTIAGALESIDSQEADRKLEKLALAKLKTLSGDQQWKLKLIRFLLSRGYSYDAVSRTVAHMAHDAENG